MVGHPCLKILKTFWAASLNWSGPLVWRIADRTASCMLNTRSHDINIASLVYFLPNVCCCADMCFVPSCYVRKIRIFHLVLISSNDLKCPFSRTPHSYLYLFSENFQFSIFIIIVQVVSLLCLWPDSVSHCC